VSTAKPVATFVPRPDGSVLVSPGAPVAWMTPREFGEAVGRSRESVYRYIGDGSIPEDQVQHIGARKIRIRASAVEAFKTRWKKKRSAGL